MTCYLQSFSTVFQSYQFDGRVNIKMGALGPLLSYSPVYGFEKISTYVNRTLGVARKDK